jgi:hypothetical protein
MGATLSTLRKYIRAEVHDPAPLRKISTSALIHDGGNDAVFFQDATFDFVALGIVVGDVIWNGSDGGSLSTIQQISGTGNRKLTVGAIEGGTNNNFTDGDTPYIYDRHAQKGLDGTRFTDTEVEDALAQAQKLVANRYGGVEKFNVHTNVKVMTKIDLTVQTATAFAEGETITGGDNGHTAFVEYVGDTFLVVSTMKTKLDVTAVGGTIETGEEMLGGTSGETAIVVTDGTTYLVVTSHPDVFTAGETLTGQTSGATVTVDDADYNPELFVAGETLTGGTSGATANVKATYANNNFYIGQALPTDLKHLVNARWWDGSGWNYLKRDSIYEYDLLHKSTGDPLVYNIYSNRIWLWPNNSAYQYSELHLFYTAWDSTLSADTDTTSYGNRMERVVVLEAAKVLAGGDADDKLYGRLLADIKLAHEDIVGGEDMHTSSVGQVIDWDTGYGPGELF